MEFITQIELADFEQVPHPRVEKSNFSFSFSFLPREERNAMNSIYAFCSYIDDIVDNESETGDGAVERKNHRLDWWVGVIERVYGHEIKNSVLAPFVSMIDRFKIPKQYFLTLIDGCRRDLYRNRYETFEELKDYCYSVASVVGLITIDVFGHKYEDTKKYAVNLGYALQLTNIMRDVKADKDRGYIYIPQEDLRRFNYSEEDLMNEVYNDNFIELMRFQASRAREYFYKARTYLHPDEKNTVFTAEMMDAIYYRLLEKIELNEYNVWRGKIRVSPVHKAMIFFKQWLSLKLFVGRFRFKNS